MEIPEELLEVPRKVRVRRGKWMKVVVVRVLLWPLVGLGVFAIGVMVGMVVWVMAGTDRVGVIEKIEHVRMGSGGGSYVITYHYDVGTVRVAGVERVSSEVMPSGVRVRMLGVPPLMYGEALTAGESGWGSVGLVWLVGMLGVGLGWMGWYFGVVLPGRQRRLYRSGEAVCGTVVEKKRGTAGKSVVYSLLYEFKTIDGGVELGNQILRQDLWKKVEVGSEVVVLYDLGRVGRNVLYGYGDYRCGG